MATKPVIFISATSDLRSARDLVGKVLYSMGYEPVWQDIAAVDGGELLDVLRRRLEPCALVVQLVGRRYGAEPPRPTPEFGRVSYTQFEALKAQQMGKRVIYHFLDDTFPLDPVALEPPDLATLQSAYVARLKEMNCLRYTGIACNEDLELSIRRISDELARLRADAERRNRRLIALSLVTVLGIGILAGLVMAVMHKLNATRIEMEARSAQVDYKLDALRQQITEAVAAKPIPPDQTQPKPIPAHIIAKAKILLERGNAEDQALASIALNDHSRADQLIQELKNKPDNPIDEAFRLFIMEGDNWFQANQPDKSVKPYEQAMNLKPDSIDARNSLTIALSFSRSGDKSAQVHKAIEIAQGTLPLCPPNSKDWAKTQNYLGIAWRNLPSGNRAENIRNAIAAYEQALTVRTHDSNPVDWAMTQNNLGIAWRNLPTGDPAVNIKKAIEAFQAALTVFTPTGYPKDWVMTQKNLAFAWSHLPGNRQENLQKSIAACDAILQAFPDPTSPNARSARMNRCWYQLLARDFAGALATATAVSGAADLPLETNHAHALLFLGRLSEARELYLRYVGQTIEGSGKTWEQVILEDFNVLESEGLTHPDMAAIRTLLQPHSAASQPTAARSL